MPKIQTYRYADRLSLPLKRRHAQRNMLTHTFQDMTHTHTHAKTFTQSTLVHGEHDRTFAHRSFMHTNTFTHKRFYTHTHKGFSPTTVFKHKRSYTQLFSYQQILFYTQAFIPRSFNTQKLLHTNTFTHRSVYTQQAFTYRSFCRPMLLPQKLLHAKPLLLHDLLGSTKTNPFETRCDPTHADTYAQPFAHRS